MPALERTGNAVQTLLGAVAMVRTRWPPPLWLSAASGYVAAAAEHLSASVGAAAGETPCLTSIEPAPKARVVRTHVAHDFGGTKSIDTIGQPSSQQPESRDSFFPASTASTCSAKRL